MRDGVHPPLPSPALCAGEIAPRRGEGGSAPLVAGRLVFSSFFWGVRPGEEAMKGRPFGGGKGKFFFI